MLKKTTLFLTYKEMVAYVDDTMILGNDGRGINALKSYM